MKIFLALLFFSSSSFAAEQKDCSQDNLKILLNLHLQLVQNFSIARDKTKAIMWDLKDGKSTDEVLSEYIKIDKEFANPDKNLDLVSKLVTRYPECKPYIRFAGSKIKN
jgi:hypothetical protein